MNRTRMRRHRKGKRREPTYTEMSEMAWLNHIYHTTLWGYRNGAEDDARDRPIINASYDVLVSMIFALEDGQPFHVG